MIDVVVFDFDIWFDEVCVNWVELFWEFDGLEILLCGVKIGLIDIFDVIEIVFWDLVLGLFVWNLYIGLFLIVDFIVVLVVFDFGGWNECFLFEVYVVFYWSWCDCYGVWLINMGFDMLIFYVICLLMLFNEVIDLVCEYYVYCNDIID